ncbi:MAG: hypothetical protein KGL50_04005, partial [Burkholderiales bacterium]|nr:hypothetical protein [Burkholderiales bacterium]
MNAAPPGAVDGAAPWRLRWQHFSAATLRAYHAYASWLVSISWRRFVVLAVILVVAVDMVHDKPPLTWRITEELPAVRRLPPLPQAPRPTPAPPAEPAEA